jgi:hypothetical protein
MLPVQVDVTLAVGMTKWRICLFIDHVTIYPYPMRGLCGIDRAGAYIYNLISASSDLVNVSA